MIEALMFVLGICATLLYQFLISSYYRIKREVKLLEQQKNSLQSKIRDYREYLDWSMFKK
jgi:hypothetical protein